MTIFLATFIVMGIAILAMAVGVMAGRRPISGSCGGLERVGLECAAGCDKPCPKRLARELRANVSDVEACAQHDAPCAGKNRSSEAWPHIERR